MGKRTKDNKKYVTRAAGFTLIEILAALALIMVVIPVVMKGISIVTAVVSDTRCKSVAVSLAENQMAAVLLEKQWQSGTLTGDFGQEYPGYHWQMDSSNWTEPGLNQVSLKVIWEARGYERNVALTTLVRTDEQ